MNTLAFIEVRQILNLKNHKNTNHRPSNKAIYPPLVTSISEDTPISALIYSKYKLLVFNLAYARIMYGKFYFIKSLKTTTILKILFYYTTGISRILILTTLTLFKTKNKKTIEVLYDIFIYPIDNRMLIRLNGVWVANGDKKKFIDFLGSAYDKCGKKISFTETQIKRIIDIHNEVHKNTTRSYKMMLFVDKDKPQIAHKALLGVTPGNNTAMETSKTLAVKNKNYGKDVIVSSYMGEKKESTLLVENLDNLIPKCNIITHTPITNQLIGAIINGANTGLMTRTYREDYERMITLTRNIDEIIIATD